MSTQPALQVGVVLLEPLRMDHVSALASAAAGDRSSFGYTWVPDGPAETATYVEHALGQAARGDAWPYAVVLASTGRVVGSTRLWDFVRFDDEAAHPQAAEIGYTWYAADVQRTGVNTAAKLLLLGYAFGTWGVERITLKTDARNERSRAAITRLGARFEGVRRAHMKAATGGIRDTAYYSVVRAEWPTVEARLEALRRVA